MEEIKSFNEQVLEKQSKVFDLLLDNAQIHFDTEKFFNKEKMSKREVFAMAAMQGLCANSAYIDFGYERIAKESVLAADELLKQLEKE